MDPRQYVRPGDPIRLAASQINGLNRLLSSNGGYRGGPQSEIHTPYTWVYGRFSPQSGPTSVPRWTPLAITGISVPPASDGDIKTASYEQMPVVTLGNLNEYNAGGSITPTTQAWCIALEPVAASTICKVAVAGVVQCKINVVHAKHTFVEVSSTGLRSSVKGEGFILWKEDGTGAGKWALVRMDVPQSVVVAGTFTGTWSKGGSKDVTEAKTGQLIRNVYNPFGTVSAAAGVARQCAIAWTTSSRRFEHEWILIAAEC